MVPHPLEIHPYTVLFNVVLLVLDVWALVSIARKRTFLAWLAAGWTILLAGAFLGLFLGGQLGFPFIQLLSWTIFLHGPILLTGAAIILRRLATRTAVLSATLAICVAAIAVDAFAIEPYRLETTTYVVTSAKIVQPTRILVIADFQTDNIGDYERSALRRAMDTKPDLILLAGDYLHREPMDPRLAADFRQALHDVDFGAPLGAFAVKGDVEHVDWPDLFRDSRVTPLLGGETTDLGWIKLTGLAEGDSHQQGPLFGSGFSIPATDGYHIVLGHAPDFALSRPPADLLVAGHTHGGQIQLPFIGPIMTLSAVPKAWAAGALTDLGNGSSLVVSRGVGMERSWAPRIRFLCAPQLVVIDLKPA